MYYKYYINYYYSILFLFPLLGVSLPLYHFTPITLEVLQCILKSFPLPLLSSNSLDTLRNAFVQGFSAFRIDLNQEKIFLGRKCSVVLIIFVPLQKLN